MDWSSNLIQIRLFIQFKPLKDTFSNPSLKARIVQLACQWCEWVQIEGLLFSLFPPLGSLWQGRTPGDRLSVQGMESTQHTCPHCHLSWEQPFKSVHFYILPPGPILRSDPNNCRIYYTKLDENWKAARALGLFHHLLSCSAHDFP